MRAHRLRALVASLALVTSVAACGSSHSSSSQDGLTFTGAAPVVGYHAVRNGPTLHITGTRASEFPAATSTYSAQVVNLWANWCTDCKTEAPVLAAAYSQLHSRGVQFVGVEERAKTTDATAFAQAHDWTWPEYVDQQGITLFSLKFADLPVTAVTDSRGTVTGYFFGAVPSVAALSQAVQAAQGRTAT